MIITVEQSIKSLRRAQALKDQGIIGQSKREYISKDDLGKVCFCAVGAIVADTLQPDIDFNSIIPLDVVNYSIDDVVTFFQEIVDMNDFDELSFGNIADELEQQYSTRDYD